MTSTKRYTLKEVAQKVGVVSATIVRWIDTGKVRMPKRKDAQGHFVFTEADLHKLVEYKNRLLPGDPTTDAPPPPKEKKDK